MEMYIIHYTNMKGGPKTGMCWIENDPDHTSVIMYLHCTVKLLIFVYSELLEE